MSHPILVFGEALVDEFPNTVVPGGAPFNVARHLAAFGANPLFLSRLGRDNAGAALREEMARYGLSAAALQQDDTIATGKVQVRESAPGCHSFHIDRESAYDHISITEFERGPWARPGFAWIYSGTLALRQATSRATYQHLIKAFHGRRYVDLNWREEHVSESYAWETFRQADVAKLNEVELQMLLGWQGLPPADLAALPQPGEHHPQVAALLRSSRIQLLALTCGAAGYAAFDHQGLCLASGSGYGETPLVDTVGAGDAFSAITLLGLLRDWPLRITLARANRFAAAICGLRGAVPPLLDFYTPWKIDWQLAGHNNEPFAAGDMPQ